MDESFSPNQKAWYIMKQGNWLVRNVFLNGWTIASSAAIIIQQNKHTNKLTYDNDITIRGLSFIELIRDVIEQNESKVGDWF